MIPQSIKETKEYRALSAKIGVIEANDFYEYSDRNLEESISEYHVELKREKEKLAEQEQYKKDCETIKVITGAERDRIKPEKNLFELALCRLEADDKGLDEYFVIDSKQYKKAEKTSGTDYVKEFMQKTSEELKDYCVRFYVIQKKVKSELEQNKEYMGAKLRKKEADDNIKVILHERECRAKMAIVVLKERGVKFGTR